MSRFLSHLFSVVFHPVFVNLLNLWLLFALFPPLSHGIPQKRQLFYISFIFISTSIIPLIMVFVLRFTSRINSVMLHQKKDRFIPYLITLLMYIFNYYNFYSYNSKYSTHPLIISYVIACAAIVGLVMAINFFSKISIHTATLGALAGLITVAGRYSEIDIRLLLMLIFIISGCVASSRIFLNAHQNMQVYSGFLLGFLLMFFML
ncbi:MAG: hypothetical protein H7296_03825 [Bacteroidia bacterium]|nr:hypothetical protein [Bacteroidia bacterium]